MARPRATAAVAVLAARIAAACPQPHLGRQASHRRQGAGDRRVGVLAPRSRHRRVARRQPDSVSKPFLVMKVTRCSPVNTCRARAIKQHGICLALPCNRHP